MKTFLFCFSAVIGLACRCGAEDLGSCCHSAVSPDGKNEIRVWVEKELAYGVFRDGKELVPRSVISLTLDGRAPLGPAARVKDVERRIISGTLPTPVGKQAAIDLSGNETRIVLEDGWALRLVARDDGVAYRFETAFGGTVKVLDEQATVGISGRCSVAYVNYDRGGWKEGGDPEQDSWEAVTRVQSPCEVGTTNGVVYLPVVFGFADGTAVSVTESDLHDYAGWLLQRDASSVGNPLVSRFSRFPLATINVNWKETDDSVKRPLRYKRVTKRANYIVETDGTRTYPWRVFQIAPRAIDLCASRIVEALATRTQDDFSWVKPGQVAWDWWNAFDNKGTKEGCTTAGYRRFVDFAAQHGVRYVILDEGWSKALDIWEYAPSVDVPEIVRYAERKGVGIILWMAAGQVYGQEEKVAAHFGALGVKGFKVDFMDREDADMIRFEESFAAACARHRLVVAYHGMSKPTGLHVAYPNVLNYEGVHGLENMKWYNRKDDFMLNDLLSLYVRMSAGPMDYTPGAMDNYPVGAYRGTYKEPGSMGTRCRQMALMILCYAPLQMLCDAPTKYERNLESFGFMSRVPAVWDETVGLAGEPTRFAVLARRKGADWWCGGIASKEGMPFELDTGFLGRGRWRATVFRDADDAAVRPERYVRDERTVRAGERIRLDMACGGGFAVRFSPIPAADAQIEDLIARMTLDEKVGQLVQTRTSAASGAALAEDASGVKLPADVAERVRKGAVGSLLGACGITNFNAFQRIAVKESRLGIPLMIGHDMIHGVKTQFPIPLALSCAWDEDLWRRCGRLIALETPLKGCNWTFAPMVDIARDARWGRIAEGPGQDPHLASRMSAALVTGIQSRDVAFPVAACLKHFVGYGAGFQGRDYNAVEMSESTLRNVYLPPFASGVEAGALTVMPAFNSLNGVPCSMNAGLLSDILRGDLGFDGFTISDWNAVLEMKEKRHGMGRTDEDLAALALNAGMDQEMVGDVFARGLVAAVRAGKVPMPAVEEAVRRVLRVKKTLGLWERPYIDEAEVARRVDFKAHAQLAREAAAKSCVLLKNVGALPLRKGLKVALVGPGMSDAVHAVGCWATYAENRENTTVVEGLAAAGVDFSYVPAYDFTTGRVDVAALRASVANADVVVASFGEHGKRSGEGWSIRRLELPSVQLEALEVLKGTGKPIVALVTGGRPLAIPELAESANAILLAWSPGTSGGEGIADVLTGAVNPSGRLTTEFPHATGQMPLFYNRTATGRPTDASKPFASCFRDGPHVALYPFGYGLGYAAFAYAKESAAVVGDKLVLSCEVTNTGRVAGEEVVQAYTRQLVGAETRPVRELRGWTRLRLEPGETRRATIEIPLSRLSYYVHSRRIPASGPVQAWIAPDSVHGAALEVSL